jgi:cell fate regulator YaaT (PSP1 superfamily)
MAEKLRDEQEALMICREKAMQRGLPMAIVDAEYQWYVLYELRRSVSYQELTMI